MKIDAGGGTTMTMLDVAPSPVAPTFRERHPLVVQLGRYVVAGGVGTLVNALVYLSLRSWWDLIPAVLAALALSTLVSTEVNRRFTFSGEQGRRWRVHVQTAGMVAFYAVYSSAVLLALHALVDDPTPLLETATVSAASVLGGAGRFLVLRFWVFDADPPVAPSLGVRLAARWHEHQRWALRVLFAAAAGTALVLTSAGSCDARPPSPGESTQTGY